MESDEQPRQFFRTTVTFYTEGYRGDEVEIEDLARAASSGDAIADSTSCDEVREGDLPPGAQEFFATEV